MVKGSEKLCLALRTSSSSRMPRPDGFLVEQYPPSRSELFLNPMQVPNCMAITVLMQVMIQRMAEQTHYCTAFLPLFFDFKLDCH